MGHHALESSALLDASKAELGFLGPCLYTPSHNWELAAMD
jgi:hypothetical protein